MALKPRYKRRIFWATLSLIGALVFALIVIPPMITLNGLKPIVEKSVYEQTNVPAKLNGNIHFSLIGGATIVAHDVAVPTAKIGAVMFSIPFGSFFDIKNAKLNDAVVVYDANITIDKLAPAMFNHDIEIYNSTINFLGREYYIVRADFTNGEFHGTIRTDDHKYDVEFIGDTFHIKNKNNNLNITGQIYSDGSTRGQMSLETDNVNEWLGFSEPKIKQHIGLTADFEWDGGTGYKFTNIIADNFSGNVEVSPNGDRTIQLVSNDAIFDFSFLLKPSHIQHQTNYNLDLYGDLKLGDRNFKHLKINAISNKNKFQITHIVADEIAITGGTITKDGAHDIMITTIIDGKNTMCLFSGTPQNWQCSKFSYGDISGRISVSDGKYNIFAESNTPLPDTKTLNQMLDKIGSSGTVKFKFADIGGTYHISNGKTTASYDYATNKTLGWIKTNIPFLPPYMMQDIGNFIWQNDIMTFTPHNQKWQLSTYDNYFNLSGHSFKSWLPKLDLRSIQDGTYTISGFYSGNKISNLNIKIKNHEFYGNASGKNITLHTDTLNIDEILNPNFVKNYSEQEFLTNAPILIPFDLPVQISLSANKLIYKNNEFSNFVYALKENSQTFSISDSARGNLLATIERDKTNYDISIQLNRFVINNKLLSSQMPLNVRDTMITAEISLNTHGQIAHDIYYNLNGTMDLSFDGGYIIGMSFDKFYASAENISILNAEYALANALGGGETKLKHMHIVGEYNQDNFITTSPIKLSMRHTDAVGGLAITNGMMTAEFDITMRGTAPTPATIQLSVMPDGGRKYSLSEIMQDFDIGFMRAFVKNHTMF
ncbi:MAG: hypothetical protein E7006_02505 [Alphaproteobacteria bacterium]|nr:hypothetical protein [Alphaproteobacteria bacterium]